VVGNCFTSSGKYSAAVADMRGVTVNGFCTKSKVRRNCYARGSEYYKASACMYSVGEHTNEHHCSIISATKTH
jgi:hypothetical protein